MIGVVAHLALQHPAISTVQEVGFWKALTSLPTPLNPVNATGFFIPTDRAPTAFELTTQEWFNYVLGDDLGSAAARYPELVHFQETNRWKNTLILPAAIRDNLPHTIAVWARNMLAGWLLYFGVGFAWAFAIYNFWGSRFFPAGLNKPQWEDMRLQMAVSARALIFYTLAPTVGEWIIERGWTYTYQDLHFIKGSFGGYGDLGGGLVGYALYTALYFLGVEWGIYWVHRLLHHPNLYWLHRDHVSGIALASAAASAPGSCRQHRFKRPMQRMSVMHRPMILSCLLLLLPPLLSVCAAHLQQGEHAVALRWPGVQPAGRPAAG